MYQAGQSSLTGCLPRVCRSEPVPATGVNILPPLRKWEPRPGLQSRGEYGQPRRNWRLKPWSEFQGIIGQTFGKNYELFGESILYFVETNFSIKLMKMVKLTLY